MPLAVKDRIFFVRFEDLIAQPVETMESIYQWLGLGSMPFSVELDLTGTDALAGRPAAWPAAWGLKASA